MKGETSAIRSDLAVYEQARSILQESVDQIRARCETRDYHAGGFGGAYASMPPNSLGHLSNPLNEVSAGVAKFIHDGVFDIVVVAYDGNFLASAGNRRRA
jgi:hypothetical protein